MTFHLYDDYKRKVKQYAWKGNVKLYIQKTENINENS